MPFIPNKSKHEQLKFTTQRKRDTDTIQKERENFEELSL